MYALLAFKSATVPAETTQLESSGPDPERPGWLSFKRVTVSWKELIPSGPRNAFPGPQVQTSTVQVTMQRSRLKQSVVKAK